jgi:hypothetical protein
MRKNVAGQVVGFQLVSAADGSPFTDDGSPTPVASVYVTGDNGSQAAGTQNSGHAVHKGNGLWTYAPSQAETNFDHVAFTAVADGAVPVTVQAYTSSPQTGDTFARLGAPVGASISADLQVVDGIADAILEDTGTTLPATLATIAGYVDTEIAAIIAAIADLPTNSELATALAGADDAVLAAISALNDLSSADIEAALAAVIATARAEPGQGAPAANASLGAKIDYLYKFARNRRQSTETEVRWYSDDAVTVDHKASHADAGGTYTRGEIAGGP